MSRNAVTTGCHTNAAVGAADSNAWASTLDDMAHNDKPAGNSDKQTRNTSVRTDFLVSMLKWKGLRYLIQVE